jgi:hypothetical protein
MHRTIQGILLGFLTVLACACQLHAVERIRVEVDPTWSAAAGPATDKIFDAAINDLEHGSFDPAATALANAEEKWTALIFNLPSLARARAITYRNSVGDNLLMEWHFQESFAEGNVILRDTPYYSTFSIGLTSGSWQTRDELGNLLAALIRWQTAPINISGLPVSVGPDYAETAAFSGMPPALFLIRGFVRDFFVLGRASQGQLFIQVDVGKSYSDGLEGVPAFVPERFPPLRALARSWDVQKILQEIGRPTDPSVGGHFSDKRDFILITELARRGLGEAEVIRLLVAVPPRDLESRASAVFSAMNDTGKDSDFDRYFQPMLAEYQRIGPSADGAVREAFRAVARRKVCAPEFEQSAVRLLHMGTVQDMALFYLGECSNSEEVTSILESVAVPEKFVHLKESILAGIQNRIERQHVVVQKP